MVVEPSVSETLARRLQGRLVDFVRTARCSDFRVGVAEELDAQRVAVHCGIADSEQLRWGLRSLLCSSREDWQCFDALFDAHWLPPNASSLVSSGIGGAGRETKREGGAAGGEAGPPDHPGGGDGADAAGEAARGGASDRESLERTDFGSLTDETQMRAMERLVEALARRMRRRLVRRERVERKGRRLHLRHTIRASLAHGGTPLRLAYRERRRRRPRLILVADVSRSMALYSRLYLRFARGLVTAFEGADAFACHTRLVPITDALRRPDQTRVAESLAVLSRGWAGGTRLGASLAAFSRDYGRLLNRQTVVILVSDGLDTGEPAELGRAVAAIRSRCRRLVWLNPLLGRPGYEPRTGGMLAALPHIDLFAPAHDLQSLAALEPALADL
jgi:uncharacterized protein with von Willebrand factor type A (vWA) domain